MHKGFFGIFLLAASQLAIGQVDTLRGFVFDSAGIPLEDAFVTSLEGFILAKTDAQGYFKFPYSTMSTKLASRRIGYEETVVEVGERDTITITLREKVVMMPEVLVAEDYGKALLKQAARMKKENYLKKEDLPSNIERQQGRGYDKDQLKYVHDKLLFSHKSLEDTFAFSVTVYAKEKAGHVLKMLILESAVRYMFDSMEVPRLDTSKIDSFKTEEVVHKTINNEPYAIVKFEQQDEDFSFFGEFTMKLTDYAITNVEARVYLSPQLLSGITKSWIKALAGTPIYFEFHVNFGELPSGKYFADHIYCEALIYNANFPRSNSELLYGFVDGKREILTMDSANKSMDNILESGTDLKKSKMVDLDKEPYRHDKEHWAPLSFELKNNDDIGERRKAIIARSSQGPFKEEYRKTLAKLLEKYQ